MNIQKLNIPTKTIITAVVAVIIFFSSVYTVNEGHIGIVKRFSEAKEQVNPGLHFKVPFIDSVKKLKSEHVKMKRKWRQAPKNKCQ